MNYKFAVLFAGLFATNIYAATEIDLRHQPANFLQKYLAKKTLAFNQDQIKTTRTYVDQNQTLHIRTQQIYAGFPVWDATAVVHVSKANQKNTTNLAANLSSPSTSNGVIYDGLTKDLANTPSYALSNEQKTQAIQHAKAEYQKKANKTGIQYQNESIETIIFVNPKKQARYAYLVKLFTDDGISGAHQPTMIIDAMTLEVYRQWDNVFTYRYKISATKDKEYVAAGGIGGNEKSGPIFYDDGKDNLPSMKMEHSMWDESTPICLVQNDDVTVKDVQYDMVPVTLCYPVAEHNNLPWLNSEDNNTRWKDDEANGANSPSLDAFFAGITTKNLYQQWYNIPVLTEEDGKTPMKLLMRVHYGRKFDNAFWDGKQMTFGDGDKEFYPLASLDVGIHEISHGFTMQHSNLDASKDQMSALHESFSDMASIAAQYFVYGSTKWDQGRNIFKGEGALRYFDDPKKDRRSIDNMKDYEGEWTMDPHLLAGVFNKAFYLIATSPNWDVHKTFDIMVKANMHYWTSSMSTYADAACGVISATKDYGYNIADVRVAFANVGIDTSKC